MSLGLLATLSLYRDKRVAAPMAVSASVVVTISDLPAIEVAEALPRLEELETPEVADAVAAPAVTEAPVAPAERVAPAWQRFAAAAPVLDGRPAIALIIDDMGPDRRRSARALALLPPAVTLSYLPYAEGVAGDVAQARARGHEIMLHLPMEAMNGRENPGPAALFVTLGPDELLRRVRHNLDRFGSYAGVNNHMGSRFTADAGAMQVVVQELAARGLYWIDSRTSSATVAERMARQAGLPTTGRDIFLDDDPAPAAILAQLNALEAVARRKGFGVAIGHPRDATLDALEQWLPEAAQRGFVLVPASAAVKHAVRISGTYAVRPGG